MDVGDQVPAGVIVASPGPVGHVGREALGGCQPWSFTDQEHSDGWIKDLADVVERAHASVANEKRLTEPPASATGFGCKEGKEHRNLGPHRRGRQPIGDGNLKVGTGWATAGQLGSRCLDPGSDPGQAAAGIPPWSGPRWPPRIAPIRPRTPRPDRRSDQAQCERRHEPRHGRAAAPARSPSGKLPQHDRSRCAGVRARTCTSIVGSDGRADADGTGSDSGPYRRRSIMGDSLSIGLILELVQPALKEGPGRPVLGIRPKN